MPRPSSRSGCNICHEPPTAPVYQLPEPKPEKVCSGPLLKSACRYSKLGHHENLLPVVKFNETPAPPVDRYDEPPIHVLPPTMYGLIVAPGSHSGASA